MQPRVSLVSFKHSWLDLSKLMNTQTTLDKIKVLQIGFFYEYRFNWPDIEFLGYLSKASDLESFFPQLKSELSQESNP